MSICYRQSQSEATPETILLIAPGTYQLKQANSFGQANVLGAMQPRSLTDSLSREDS